MMPESSTGAGVDGLSPTEFYAELTKRNKGLVSPAQ